MTIVMIKRSRSSSQLIKSFVIIVATGINRSRNHRRDRAFAIIIAINQIAGNHRRGRVAGLRDLRCRRTGSVAIIVAIESSRSRDPRRPRA
jgi:hypothetical protein